MDNFLKRVKQVIDVEATTTSVGDFFLTHMPFDNLFIFEKGSTMFESAIDEESLYREVLIDNADLHQFVMIQGSQGCGKSHLIRWMKEKYLQDINPKKEAVLFISRSHNTLKDAIEQILRSNIFSDEIKENELKKIKDASVGLTGEKLALQIVFNFYLAVMNDDGKDCELSQRHRDWLKAFLQDDYIKQKLLLIEKGPIERIRAKLENSGSSGAVNQDESPIFDDKSFIIELSEINGRLRSDAARDVVRFAELLNTDAMKEEFREKIATYLNKKVSEVIRRSLTFKTTDFKKLFQSLRMQLKSQDMQLTLFIEDITSFSGLDETLMEVLITNHQVAENSQYCRIISICGATRKFYDDNVPDNFKERITKNILIKEESVLGKPEKLAQFAARYINAIRVPEADVAQWNAAGANIRNIPIDKTFLSRSWATVDVDDHKLSIYPFNQTALWNLYQIILLERRTPRMLLKYVILHILEKLVLGGKARFLDEKNFNNGEIRVPAWADVSQEQSNDNYNSDFATQRAILLRVWGNQTTVRVGDKVGDVERAIFIEFGIPTDIFEAPDPGPGPASEPGPGPGPGPLPPHPPSPPKIDEYEVLYKELTEWQERGETLASHIFLRDQMLERIMDALDWEAEGVMPLFVRTYFSSRNHISIEGQKVEIKPDSFVIKRSKEARYALLAVAAFRYKGNNSWDIDGSSDAYINFMTWLQSVKAEIISVAKDPKNVGVDVGFLNIASEYVCKLLTGQIKPIMKSDDIYSAICEGLKTPLIALGHSDAWRETQSLIAEKGKELHANNLEFFAKNWGVSLKGKAIDKYTYLDVHEIYIQIEKLAALGFDLTKIKLNAELPSNTLYGVPSYMIETLVKRFERLVTDERAVVNANALFVQSAIGEDYTKAIIATVIDEMNAFLDFLSADLNTPYPTAEYGNLRSGKLAADRIMALLDTLKAMTPTLSRQEMIAKLTEIDISFLIMCSDIFRKFLKLLNEKQALVQDCGVGQGVTDLSNARKSVKDEASEMKRLIGGV